MKNCEYQQIDPRALGTSNTRTSTTLPCGRKNSQRLRRKWEVFPGNNRFYCDGRIMMGRQCGVLPLTIGLIFITSGLFFTFDCPFLVDRLTVFIPVIGGVLFVFVIMTLLQTSFTDPGILPRALPDEAVDIERQIERFDHHCPWVGNCVGKRNYRFFYAFIVSLSFLTSFIFGCVITHLTLRSQGVNGIIQAIQDSPARYPFFSCVPTPVSIDWHAAPPLSPETHNDKADLSSPFVYRLTNVVSAFFLIPFIPNRLKDSTTPCFPVRMAAVAPRYRVCWCPAPFLKFVA
ncbi:hypothetical protein cypCar_00030196 [Cyprinus carpio]|nr:hypothetical protein cypCar_00030196 [Cyprinus carpio]